MKIAKCKCGNNFKYMTIFNQVQCLKCGEMVPVEPCTEEELNPPPPEEEPTEEYTDGTGI